MDEPYSQELSNIIRQSEAFRAILASSVRELDLKCSSTGGSAEDRAEMLPSKQLRDELDGAMLPLFMKEYPEYSAEFEHRMSQLQKEIVKQLSAPSSPTVSPSITEEPVFENDIVDSPTTLDVIVDEPLQEEDILESSATVEDIVDEAPQENPVLELSATSDDIINEPILEEDIIDEPTNEVDASDEQVHEEDIVDEPVHEEDIVDEPVHEEDIVAEPIHEEDEIDSPDVSKDTPKEVVAEDYFLSSPAVPEAIVNEAARTPFRPVDFMQTPSPRIAQAQNQTGSPRTGSQRSKIPRPSLSRLSISSLSSISRPRTPQPIITSHPNSDYSQIPRPNTPRANTSPMPSTPLSSYSQPKTPRTSISQANTPRSNTSRRDSIQSTTSRASFRSTTSRASFRSSTSTTSFRSSISRPTRPVTPRATTSPDPRVSRASFASPTLASLAKKRAGSSTNTPTKTPRSSTPSSSRVLSLSMDDINATPLSARDYSEFRPEAQDADEEREYTNGFLSSLSDDVNADAYHNDSPDPALAATPSRPPRSAMAPKRIATAGQSSILSAVRKQRSRPSIGTPRKTT